MQVFPFKLKNTYSFSVYPSAILGNDFQKVTILGILDRETAETFTNVTVKLPLILPYLPAGSSKDPADYTYLTTRHSTGVVSVTAAEWIQYSTVTEYTETTARIAINKFPPDQVPLLREILIANGFTDFNIELQQATTVIK